MKAGAIAFLLGLVLGLACCYAHVPPAPGEPNPADLPPVWDRKAMDGGAD